ncbi:hypothetical protein AZH51_03790 [Branchiibius sp. NY16-3462-2]|nr:hypothetical protein AZH51_03790 [Branchiibius sp. NY16-3462-2]
MSAAVEAAQKVVDTVTSWDYSATDEKIEDKLLEGLQAAGVSVSDTERDRLLDEISALKQDETAGTPQVQEARPSSAEVV